MRGSVVVLVGVLVLTLAIAAPAGAQERTCRIESKQYGTIEYPCGSGEGGTGSADDGSIWNRLDLILGVVGIVGSAGAGAYTFYRVRSRRRALTVTLAAIERAYVDAKSVPEAGLARLAELRADLRQQHEKGRLDDAHFLELDKRATQYLVRLRMLEVDRRFATLPPLLLNEIRRLLADGVLSQAEADLIEVRAAAYRIAEAPRAELSELARRWAAEDAPPIEEPAPAQ